MSVTRVGDLGDRVRRDASHVVVAFRVRSAVSSQRREQPAAGSLSVRAVRQSPARPCSDSVGGDRVLVRVRPAILFGGGETFE